MRKITLKTMLVTAALCLSSLGAWAQITTFPTTESFDAGTTGIFEGGEIKSNSSIGNVISVTSANSEAVAYFDGSETEDGVQPLPLIATDKITVSFLMYAGWESGNETTKFSIKNSEGIELFSYTYKPSTCNVTDVSIGGSTVSGFSAFFGQSKTGSKDANGFTAKNQSYVATDGYNTTVTISISGSGAVMASFNKSAHSIDKEFNGVLGGDIKMDIASINLSGKTATSDRECGFDNFSISKETVEEASYKVVAKCGNITLYENTYFGTVGQTPALSIEQGIYVDGKKYIYESDDASIQEIKADGSTEINVTYREAETYSYTVNATDGTETLEVIAAGSAFEGETINYAYNLYVNKERTLYKKGATNSQYNGSFVLTENNQTVNLTYAATDITNVTYWSEAEDIEGMTIITEGNTTVRSSASASAYASEDVKFTTLPAGKYKIVVNICDAVAKEPQGVMFNFKAGESVFFGYAATSINNSLGSGEFNLVEAADISIAQAGRNKLGIDYIYIQRIGDATTTQSVSISENGIATFTPSVALDFTNAENIKAYTATVSDSKVILTETTTVAAGEGVIIQSVNGGAATEDIAVANPTTATEGNALVGTLVDIATLATTDGTNNNYILNFDKDDKPGFYQANDQKVAAGKAYLQVPVEAAAEAKALTIVWNDGETTGIEENSEFGIMDSSAATYDLSGRKVANPTKGLYIKNGKKFIVK